MRALFLLPFAVVLASAVTAQAPDAPGKLPIDVPHGATVNFEADSPGGDLLPVIQQLLNSGVMEPGGRPETIVVKTGLGNIELTPHDVAALLKPVRELHVVTYTVPKDSVDDPIRHHEDLFAAEGMRRVANDSGFLLMRRTGDHYAVVLRQHDNVTVMRIDGMPDLGVATNVILRSIASAAQHATKSKSAGL